MRQFASSRFRLWNLSPAAKLIYTFFCGLSLLAIVSSVLLYEDLVGPSLRSGHVEHVERYYGKDPAKAVPAQPAQKAEQPAGGPAIALPEDEATVQLEVAMPYRKLLEVTHFHLFTIPVFVLILTHLYLLTDAEALGQLVWISLAWLSALLHILAPWLIRFGSRHLALSYPLSGFGLFVACGWLTVYPVYVMWRGKAPAPSEPTPPKKAEVAPPFSD
ncbi:MAG TPA: hypothetical protein PLY80_09745 [Pseudomonadota bacterium]|nr:hypothetical protein [Pseudomonadota bacterium]